MHRFILSVRRRHRRSLPSPRPAHRRGKRPGAYERRVRRGHLMVSTGRARLGKVTGVVTLEENLIRRSPLCRSDASTPPASTCASRNEIPSQEDIISRRCKTGPSPSSRRRSLTVSDMTKFNVIGDRHARGHEGGGAQRGWSPKPFKDPTGNVKSAAASPPRSRNRSILASSGDAWTAGAVVGENVDVTIDIEPIRQP